MPYRIAATLVFIPMGKRIITFLVKFFMEIHVKPSCPIGSESRTLSDESRMNNRSIWESHPENRLSITWLNHNKYGGMCFAVLGR
jgi:hypothetical protein